MNDWRKYTPKEYNQTDLAYLAGIIDGEGSIYIGNFSCNPITKVPYFQTNIQVTNTDKKLIDWLNETFGGLTNKRSQKQHDSRSRKQAYTWTASGDRLTHLCQLILPYIICKKRQVEIMLEMRATFNYKSTARIGVQGTQQIPVETLETRYRLMNEMRSLHIRTHSYKNKGHLPRVTISSQT